MTRTLSTRDIRYGRAGMSRFRRRAVPYRRTFLLQGCRQKVRLRVVGSRALAVRRRLCQYSTESSIHSRNLDSPVLRQSAASETCVRIGAAAPQRNLVRLRCLCAEGHGGGLIRPGATGMSAIDNGRPCSGRSASGPWPRMSAPRHTPPPCRCVPVAPCARRGCVDARAKRPRFRFPPSCSPSGSRAPARLCSC